MAIVVVVAPLSVHLSFFSSAAHIHSLIAHTLQKIFSLKATGYFLHSRTSRFCTCTCTAAEALGGEAAAEEELAVGGVAAAAVAEEVRGAAMAEALEAEALEEVATASAATTKVRLKP